MILSICLGLHIDRIHVTANVPSKELYSWVWDQLYEMTALQKDLVPHGIIKIAKKKYSTRLSYYSDKKRKIAEFEVGTTKSQYRYVKLGMFPSQFRENEFGHFKTTLSELPSIFRLPSGEFYAASFC